MEVRTLNVALPGGIRTLNTVLLGSTYIKKIWHSLVVRTLHLVLLGGIRTLNVVLLGGT